MKFNFLSLLIISVISSFFLFSGCAESGNSESVETESETQTTVSDTKVYELRTYTTHEGKLDDLHERFENHTMAFFEKHGMTNIGYWSPEDPELRDNTLIYLLSHESREAAEDSWEAFRNDPGWQEAYEASRADGPIVESIESIFMKSTPYSQMK